jgi:hypothetical protein
MSISMVDINRRFRETCYNHHLSRIAAKISKYFVTFTADYQVNWQKYLVRSSQKGMATLIGLSLCTEGTRSCGRKENAGSIDNVGTRTDLNCR